MPLEEILTFLDTHLLVLKDIVLYPHLLAFLVKACELDSLGVVQSFSVDQNVLNLTLQWEEDQEFIISKALQITWIQVVCAQAFGNQWYRGRANVAFPFFYNLWEPFSLNVQLLCSAITITTCMLLNVCLINFITGCI